MRPPFVVAPLVVLCWAALTILGVGLAAANSILPPSWDALSYVQKAKTFWDMVASGVFVNPFNLEPTLRPPGTILMSYPFGFDADFRWFHFRSVVIPIMMLIAAVYIAGFKADAPAPAHITLAALTLTLMGLPLLYQFEPNSLVPTELNWGMVDNFMAGAAALAFASAMRGIACQSLAWSITAALFAVLCLLIKPSGALIMALVAGSWGWLLLSRVQWRIADLWHDTGLRSFALKGIGINSTIFFVAIAAAWTSDYFSAENVAFGARVINILQNEITLAVTVPMFADLIHISLGFMIPLVMAAGLMAALKPDQRATLGPALICLAAGLWFWLVQTEPWEPRYFTPFAVGTFILFVPGLMDAALRMSAAPRALFQAFAVLPTLVITALLFYPSPPLSWQKALGISLVRNPFAAESLQAKTLLQSLGESPVRFYLFSINDRLRSFQAILDYAALVERPAGNISVFIPVDWQRFSTHRLEDILRSDYLVFEPIKDERTRTEILALKSVPDFYAESRVFDAWFTTLTDDDGVSVVSETGLRVLKITDTKQLNTSLERLKESYDWPQAFIDGNQQLWRSLPELVDLRTQTIPATLDATFKTPLDVDLITVRSAQAEIKNRQVEATLFLESAPALNPTDDWQLFAHLVDAGGVILGNAQVGVIARDEAVGERVIRRYGLLYAQAPDNATHVAFGFFKKIETGLEFMTSTAPITDWNGQRMLIPLTAQN